MSEAWRLSKVQKGHVNRVLEDVQDELDKMVGTAGLYVQQVSVLVEQLRHDLYACEHCGSKHHFHDQQCVHRIARVIYGGGGTGEIWSGSKKQAERMQQRARGFAWDRHGANCTARKPWFCKSKRVWISGFAVYADHSDELSMQRLGEYINA